MTLSKFTVDVQNVQALNDRPNANTGLTADQVKAAFDKAGEDLKEFVNDTLTPEVDAAIAAVVAGTGLANGAVTAIKLATNSVETLKIAEGAVTTSKIAEGALDGRYYTESEIDSQNALLETKSDLTTNRKLSPTGDFTGTLNGYEIVAADPGLSSTVAALQADVASREVNIKSEPYNASVDGTTDDTIAVQAAIDAVFAAGGGNVFFPKGTCILSGITAKSNVNLIGVPNASIIKLKSGSTTGLIVGNAANDFLITGMVLDGNKVAMSGGDGLSNIKLTNCSQVEIRENTCKNSFFGHGVHLIGGSNNVVVKNALKDNGANGIIFTESTYLRITNNRIQSNGVRGIADYGVTNFNSAYITINMNTIIGNIQDGISLEMDYGNLEPKTSYVWVTKNMVRNNGTYGILCQAEHTTIFGNKIITNGTLIGHQGIIVQAQYPIVTNNRVIGNSGVGIDMGNCAEFVVSNNFVKNNGCLGIEIASSNDGSVTGNTVIGNNAINYGVTSAGGIMVYGSTDYPLWTGVSSDVLVSGNRVKAGAYQNYGIYVGVEAVNVTIQSNALANSGGVSDIYNGSPFAIIKDNTTSSGEFTTRNEVGLINENFDIAQRGVTNTNPFSGAITLDHWKTLNAVDGGTLPANIIHSQQLLTSGDIQGSFYHYRINVDGAGSSLGVNSSYDIRQLIERGVRYRCGINKKVTISFWARSSIANKRIGISAIQNYGSGGSPSAQEILTGAIFNLTTTWQRFTYTFNTKTLVGKTFGTNHDDVLSIILFSMWGSTQATIRFGGGTAETFRAAGNIDIAQVSDADGYSTLPFLPKNIDEVYKKALRYAFIPQTNTISVRLTSYTADTLVFDLALPVQMKDTPAIRGTVNTDILVRTVAGVAQTGFTAAAVLTSNGVRVTMTKTAHGLTDAHLEVRTQGGFEAEF